MTSTFGTEHIPNGMLAGQFVHFDDPALNARYPDGVYFTLRGYPNFVPYARAAVSMPDPPEGMGVDEVRVTDVLAANQAVSATSEPLYQQGRPDTATPDGWVWHHVEHSRSLLLLPAELHAALRHRGGIATLQFERADRPGLWHNEQPPHVSFSRTGSVPDDVLRQLESHLGYPLPPPYRAFLGATNGGAPLKPAVNTDYGFIADQQFFGLYRDEPFEALTGANARLSDRFTGEFLAIAHVQGGMLLLKVLGEAAGSVWYWDDDDPRDEGRDPFGVSGGLLYLVGDNFNDFARRLVEVPPKMAEIAQSAVAHGFTSVVTDPDVHGTLLPPQLRPGQPVVEGPITPPPSFRQASPSGTPGVQELREVSPASAPPPSFGSPAPTPPPSFGPPTPAPSPSPVAPVPQPLQFPGPSVATPMSGSGMSGSGMSGSGEQAGPSPFAAQPPSSPGSYVNAEAAPPPGLRPVPDIPAPALPQIVPAANMDADAFMKLDPEQRIAMINSRLNAGQPSSMPSSQPSAPAGGSQPPPGGSVNLPGPASAGQRRPLGQPTGGRPGDPGLSAASPQRSGSGEELADPSLAPTPQEYPSAQFSSPGFSSPGFSNADGFSSSGFSDTGFSGGSLAETPSAPEQPSGGPSYQGGSYQSIYQSPQAPQQPVSYPAPQQQPQANPYQQESYQPQDPYQSQNPYQSGSAPAAPGAPPPGLPLPRSVPPNAASNAPATPSPYAAPGQPMPNAPGSITRDRALAIADEWINTGMAPHEREIIRVHEFTLGYVVWGVRAGAGPDEQPAAMAVIDRQSGELTMWPSLAPEQVAAAYERKYHGESPHPLH